MLLLDNVCVVNAEHAIWTAFKLYLEYYIFLLICYVTRVKVLLNDVFSISALVTICWSEQNNEVFKRQCLRWHFFSLCTSLFDGRDVVISFSQQIFFLENWSKVLLDVLFGATVIALM